MVLLKGRGYLCGFSCLPVGLGLVFLFICKVQKAPANLSHHRGGEEVLLDVGGQDATEAFEDVGHSDEAREILETLLVGTLKRVVCYRYPSLPSSIQLLGFFTFNRKLLSTC